MFHENFVMYVFLSCDWNSADRKTKRRAGITTKECRSPEEKLRATAWERLQCPQNSEKSASKSAELVEH